MEAMWTRFLPAIERSLQMVAAGEIGELRGAQASVGGLWHGADVATAPERNGQKALGSGVLLDVGVCTFFASTVNH